MINLRQLTFTILLLCTLGCSKTDAPNTEEVKTEIAKTDGNDTNGSETNGSDTDNDQSIAPETAKYQLTFNAEWSFATHPNDFPSGPHFSGIIGMTHNADVQLFKNETSATQGIKNMSETGGKGALSKEIYAWISEKKAKSLISGAGISRSPGSVTVEFTIEKSHSRVSVASMIAPSPDWFIAVRDVELFEKNKWITEKSLQVGVYDAGTDAGTTFTSPNQTENKTIQKITTPPLAVDGKVNSMGTITFKQIE